MKPFSHIRRDATALRVALPAVLVLCGLISFLDAKAQDRTPAAQGILAIREWPLRGPASAAPSDFEDFRLLPFVDSLTVGYRFREVDGRPAIEIAVEWTPGREGILDGRRVDREQLPDDIVIESIDVLSKVVVDSQVVGDFFLPLDTLRLSPSPSVALIDVRDIDWDAVFSDAGAEETRDIFDSGFVLQDLRILRIVFATNSGSERRPEPRLTDDRTTVIVPDADIWVTWGRRPRWHPPIRRITKSGRDRRDEIGRPDLVERDRGDRGYDREADNPDEAPVAEETDEKPSEERTARRTGDKDTGGLKLPGSRKKDDDDDDEDRLLPAALAGAALVGGLAVLGGTFGYMGNVDKAPIGLMAGRVMPRGGVLVHVAINRQVFGKSAGPENLVAGITGFGDVFRSRIQPAIGLGVRITEEGTASTRTIPSLSLGVVGNFDMLILHAAYDVEAGDIRLGIGINLRANSTE